MDFLYGILLIILLIFGIYNFGSISLSDSNTSQKSQTSNNMNNKNYLVAARNSNFENSSEKKIPEPIVASSPLALNKKINLEVQTYDYNKYFFV